MEHEELINKYFQETLDQGEKEQFDALLENNKGFKEQFLFEKDLREAIKDQERKALKLKLQDLEKNLARPATSKTTSWKIWRIAASVAVLIAAGWYIYNSNFKGGLSELYEANYDKYPNTVYNITRGSEDNTAIRKAFVAYEANDDSKAIALFQELKQSEYPIYIDFYIAQSYLKLGKNKEAITLMEQLAYGDGQFKAEALWYLSLGYIKANDKENAINSLQALILDGNYKKEEAKALLKQLN